jgi:hypothetical protein
MIDWMLQRLGEFTGHNGKTHYLGIDCWECRFADQLQLEVENRQPVNKFLSDSYTKAQELLRDDDLVWSNDLDGIRPALADVFSEAQAINNYELTTLNYLAELLIGDE